MKKGQAMNAVASDEWPAKSLQYYGTAIVVIRLMRRHWNAIAKASL
jgi:hypothetical protein